MKIVRQVMGSVCGINKEHRHLQNLLVTLEPKEMLDLNKSL